MKIPYRCGLYRGHLYRTLVKGIPSNQIYAGADEHGKRTTEWYFSLTEASKATRARIDEIITEDAGYLLLQDGVID